MHTKSVENFYTLAEAGPPDIGRHGYQLTDDDKNTWSLMVWGQLELKELYKKYQKGEITVHRYVIERDNLSQFIKGGIMQ